LVCFGWAARRRKGGASGRDSREQPGSGQGLGRVSAGPGKPLVRIRAESGQALDRVGDGPRQGSGRFWPGSERVLGEARTRCRLIPGSLEAGIGQPLLKARAKIDPGCRVADESQPGAYRKSTRTMTSHKHVRPAALARGYGAVRHRDFVNWRNACSLGRHRSGMAR
jgi:hypothetical protein